VTWACSQDGPTGPKVSCIKVVVRACKPVNGSGAVMALRGRKSCMVVVVDDGRARCLGEVARCVRVR